MRSILQYSRHASMRPAIPMFRRFLAAQAGLSQKDVESRVLQVLKNFDKVDPSKVTPVAHFAKDLNLDSLDTVEVVMALEDEFNVEIPDTDFEKIHSTQDAIKYITAQPTAK